MLMSVEEALARILSQVAPLPLTETALESALGLVLAEDITANRAIPPWDNSAMDGYAVRAADTAGASPTNPLRLRVIADLAAGYITDVTVTSGTAIRIMTGAPMPAGADAVVQFEDTDRPPARSKVARDHGSVTILRPVEVAQNVRPQGEDVRAGSTVLAAGTTLRPAEIGLLASQGRATAPAHKRPVVAVLATGDELVPFDQEPRAGQIYNSNNYAIASAVSRVGGSPRLLGVARDSVEEIKSKLRAAVGADLLLTTGGVSMGDFDFVRDVLATEGKVDFWRVRMKPGKPLAFGRVYGIPHLGLPGNPVSALVSFEVFARPALLKMLGRTNYRRPSVTATLIGSAKGSDGRRAYLRASVRREGDRFTARLAGAQSSGILSTWASANALVVLPEETRELRAGDQVQAFMLDWPEDENL
ncbi:MAG: molybdopterin molybdotransferase MoeA [Chloroflexota bacterium]